MNNAKHLHYANVNIKANLKEKLKKKIKENLKKKKSA